MIQLRYLEPCWLCLREKTRQDNGAVTETFEMIKRYLIQVQDLYDEVSASIYGADLNKTMRITSPKNVLESFLMDKINFTTDNVTNYAIRKGNFIYEILSVKRHWIDIRILCEISQNYPSA